MKHTRKPHLSTQNKKIAEAVKQGINLTEPAKFGLMLDRRDAIFPETDPKTDYSVAIKCVRDYARKSSKKPTEGSEHLIMADYLLRSSGKASQLRPRIALHRLNQYLPHASGEEAQALTIAAVILHKRVKDRKLQNPIVFQKDNMRVLLSQTE